MDIDPESGEDIPVAFPPDALRNKVLLDGLAEPPNGTRDGLGIPPEVGGVSDSPPEVGGVTD